MNEVEGWRQKDLLITRDQAIPLEEDEFFITDLIGLNVVTDEGETELESLEDGSCLVFQAGPSFVLKAENSSLRTAEPAKLADLLAVLTILCGGAAVWLMRRRKTRKSA